MSGIFISYRRSDVAGWAHALRRPLADRFGPERIFIDVDSIEPGLDFVEAIEKSLDCASVVLVLIGKRWNTDQRLGSSRDFVRLEVSMALERKLRLIPVLLDGAEMPEPEELPEELRPLTRRQAFQISEVHFGGDVANLTKLLSRLVETTDAPAPPSVQAPAAFQSQTSTSPPPPAPTRPPIEAPQPAAFRLRASTSPKPSAPTRPKWFSRVRTILASTVGTLHAFLIFQPDNETSGFLLVIGAISVVGFLVHLYRPAATASIFALASVGLLLGIGLLGPLGWLVCLGYAVLGWLYREPRAHQAPAS